MSEQVSDSQVKGSVLGQERPQHDLRRARKEVSSEGSE